MDYPELMFSFSYLRTNLGLIGSGGLPILILVCLATVLLSRAVRPSAYATSRKSFQDALFFFAFTAIPIAFFHLFYFYPNERFYLPILAGLAVLVGSMLALLIGPGRGAVLKLLLPTVFLLAVAVRIAIPPSPPLRRVAADRVRAHTPENAMIISGIDPVYLARLAGYGSSRRIVPISRNVEFAWVILVRKRIDEPRLRSLKMPSELLQALDLLRPRAEEAVQFVASERMDEIVMEVAQGTPVFVDASFIDTRDIRIAEGLKARFRFVECAPLLFQLRLR
jgi:hypothetical protein